MQRSSTKVNHLWILAGCFLQGFAWVSCESTLIHGTERRKAVLRFPVCRLKDSFNIKRVTDKPWGGGGEECKNWIVDINAWEWR